MKVSKVILGCMSYSDPRWQGWVLGEAEAMEHIKHAYGLGINAFDTANVYSDGIPEVILGKAIKKHNLPRDEIVVMTKVFGLVQRIDERDDTLVKASAEALRYTNGQALSRKHIIDSVKHSLERLQLDYIDLLRCNRFDPDTPIEETIQALHDVIKAGYVRYVGMSSCYAWQFQKMQYYALNHGLTPFISKQNLHNAVYGEEEREMTPMLKDLGAGCIPWQVDFCAKISMRSRLAVRTTRNELHKNIIPLANNASFRWLWVNGDPKVDPFLATINQRVKEAADKRGLTMAQVALAWSLSKDFVTAPL